MLRAQTALALYNRSRRTGERFARCRRGTFAVEFALISPMIFLLLLGVYDLSLVMKSKFKLQSASQVGVQYGLVRRPTQGDMQPIVNAVRASMPQDWLLEEEELQPVVDVTQQCECSLSGAIACSNNCPSGEIRMSYLQVEISKTHKFLFDYPALGGIIRLKDKSLVRLQ